MGRTLPADPDRLFGCPLTFDELLDCSHRDAHHGPDPDDLELALGDELVGQGPANSQETGGIGNAKQEWWQIDVRFHVGAKRAGITNLMDPRDSLVMRDELRRTLRGATHRGDGAEVVEALSDADVRDYLQLAGGGVLTALAQEVDGSAKVAERFTAALRARRWEGDEKLAAELDAALGLAAMPQLVDLPVDLEELSELLEDAQGDGGAIHLRSGEVWPMLVVDYTEETGEEAPDLEDQDEWLLVHSGGSRPGYRDMEVFIATVADPAMVDRLSIAIDGPGAFGRFRKVLERDDDLFGQWYGFSEERRLGRARAWLADAGYRPQPRR